MGYDDMTEIRLDQMVDTKKTGYKITECCDYLDSLVNEIIGIFVVLVVILSVCVFYNFCSLQ